MPLSITLPSTKPTAEIPIGEGTIQGLEYVWLDEDIPKSKMTNKYGWYELRFDQSNNITDVLSVDINLSSFKIPNPLHRPLKDGSTITLNITNAFLSFIGENYYNLVSGFNDSNGIWIHGIGEYSQEVEGNLTDVNLCAVHGNTFYVSPGNSIAGVDTLINSWYQDAYPEVVATLVECASDNDYIYIKLTNYDASIYHRNHTRKQNFTHKLLKEMPTMRSYMPNDSYDLPHIKLTGKLLY